MMVENTHGTFVGRKVRRGLRERVFLVLANYPTVRSDFFHTNLLCYVLYFQLLKDCWQLVGTFFEQLELQYIWKGSREKNRIFATENSPIPHPVLYLDE